MINKETFNKVGGQLKVFTHDTVKLASTSGQELPILGAVDVWVKLEDTDRYKLEALVVDGIDEELILGVNELKLLGLLDQEWPYVEVKQTDDEEQKMARSGYPQEYRSVVIKSGVIGFERQLAASQRGERPLFRPRE